MSVMGCFGTLLKMIVSMVALVSLLSGYALLGAYVFSTLEGPHELETQDAEPDGAEPSVDVAALREELTQAVWDAARTSNGSDWRGVARQQLKRYEDALQTAFTQEATNTDTNTQAWDFWGSLVYATTVFTTVGYGHIAPVTDMGRIATMVYALVGIPLCLVVMAGLGRAETRILKCLWAPFSRLVRSSTAKRLRCVTDPKTNKQVIIEEEVDNTFKVDEEFNLPPIIALIIMAMYLVGGAYVYSSWEDWSLLDSFYFIFITTSTIGFGDMMPEKTTFMLATTAYLLFGLSLVAMVFNVITEAVDAVCSTTGSVLLAADEDKKVKKD